MHTILLGMLGALTFAVAQPSWAQSDFPDRPIRLIVTSAAGGTGDTIARAVAKIVGEELNTNIVVDNRPGASGIIATQALVNAAPDGYTLMHTSSSLSTNAATGRKLPYDTMKDIVPLSNLATSDGYIVLVNPKLPADSVKELIALSKKQNINYGSPGPGNPIHFHTEMLALRAGTKMTHVPYKGLAPALIALMSGEIQLLLASRSRRGLTSRPGGCARSLRSAGSGSMRCRSCRPWRSWGSRASSWWAAGRAGSPRRARRPPS